MNKTSKKLVLGLGHRARQGKDAAAAHIIKERGQQLNIETIAFADALRNEVNTTCNGLIATGIVRTQQDALAYMCRTWNAAFDPNAVADSIYKWGKQRALLQAIGQGRRDAEPDYWVKRWAGAVSASNADVVLVTDMRYPNELKVIKELGGCSVKFTRVGYQGLSPEAAAHISENALNDAEFDYYITARDGQLPWLRSQALHLFDYLTR
jgi:hypothetical protein